MGLVRMCMSAVVHTYLAQTPANDQLQPYTTGHVKKPSANVPAGQGCFDTGRTECPRHDSHLRHPL